MFFNKKNKPYIKYTKLNLTLAQQNIDRILFSYAFLGLFVKKNLE